MNTLAQQFDEWLGAIHYELDDKWVLRDVEGAFIDFDQYRSDLAERNDIWLESNLA